MALGCAPTMTTLGAGTSGKKPRFPQLLTLDTDFCGFCDFSGRIFMGRFGGFLRASSI
jgi:hypothetical protein